MNNRSANLFRFSFAIFDLLGLNLVQAVLVVFLKELEFGFYFILLGAANIIWLMCAYLLGVYIGKDIKVEEFFKRSIQAFVLFFSILLLFIFLYKYEYSRLFVLLTFGCFGTIILVSRTAVLGANYYFRRKQKFNKTVVIIGMNQLGRQVVRSIRKSKQNIFVQGCFDDKPSTRTHLSVPLLGKINESVPYAIAHGIDEIYCTISPEMNPEIYHLAQEAEHNFIRFKFVPDFRMFVNRTIHIDFVGDIPIISLRPEPLEDQAGRYKKRFFDVVFSSLVILFILSWLVPLIALIIKLDSRGPVFFTQLRSGKNNKEFLCYKFRSLKVNKEADIKQVTSNDDRFTKIGKMLRKTNLDELPQFFNVFWGEMSVVGPRPHMLKHTEEYSKIISRYMVRHFLKPGVTGWAQINGYRGQIQDEYQLEKRIEYDIYYMENWSMWLDVRIILLTVYNTLKGEENAF